MQQMPLQQQSSGYPASFQQHNTLLPPGHHLSTASLPLTHQQQAVSMPLSHQPQSAPLPPSRPQQIGYRSSSFVDSNPAFQDLSESFKSLYKTVFETPQGLFAMWIITIIPLYMCLKCCFYRAMHFSAKRGLAIACPSVCLWCWWIVWSHRLEILETNCTDY